MQSLQPFHTFHISVQAHQIIEAKDIGQLKETWAEAKAQHLPVLFLGQGSNMLFLEDFNGVVIINRLLGITHKQDEHFHYLHINAGENWNQLVEWTLEQGIDGLENLALIPGCAGSAPIQNIGAYGVEFKDFCHYVDVLDLNSDKSFRLSVDDCDFGYRESVFKHRYQTGYVITAVGLKLAKNWQPVLKYGSLVNFDPQTVTAKQIFDEVCRIRQSKLPNPSEFGNAGSFFKNPVVSAEQFADIQKLSENIPHFPQNNGSVKLAAGWLIDQCHLKGFQIGGAAVHEKQALVLINKENATGQDVVKLAHYIRKSVAEKFGVLLQPEVRFIGVNGEVDSEKAIA
ncbi:UDP-N-acetylmuramate dehydrogenase [Rodentibacter trehalosifermentans]|uniref:UDP-N-acetylenolpyruvoylglucosamine reductase n=1 Tax=Rodentibacter trehalosifermentans TaxID=1908263 RepID=A0A1V3IUP1_9PAST|nr:UDP-N-acetylmuramate dehydrogenase [Rodentibacter trehalosifermentans]OOF45760.1 UDP-N-acetylenolpyruvoylglucosamine reductase [Rodentibacter trehalosifermentans]OOF49343.1 UDP-N-acetylenolpyruvoylglucosamine reductase [Rodentibacter trehalosifermentans]OOF51340.1 UDP-N-acetylenolpyruvoylglucosamine reductase [Rodentibacter trehalosifermentans]